MLVLTRKSDERILIGGDVEIVVLSVQGQRVKLGIVAAADKRVVRSECLEACFDRAALEGMTFQGLTENHVAA